MSLEDLGNIGEFVGAIAVVVSLIYLALQIRQNTTSLRLGNYLASETLAQDSAKLIIEDPDLAKLFRVGQRDYGSLDADEKSRFITFFALQFRAYEQMFLQHRSGLIDSEVWEARRDAMLRWIAEPGVQEMWKQRGHSFSRGFREFLEQEGPTSKDRSTRRGAAAATDGPE